MAEESQDINALLTAVSRGKNFIIYVYLLVVTCTLCCVLYLYRKQYVFLSANHLVNQTNLLMKTVKDALE